MTIQDVVSQFNTTPFIFAGSGITRRYYNLPDWAGLLSVFANRISKDPFAYRAYENRAQYVVLPEDKMPMIATLIEKDFNEAWFADKAGIRTNAPSVMSAVATPFKAEICEYISQVRRLIRAMMRKSKS